MRALTHHNDGIVQLSAAALRLSIHTCGKKHYMSIPTSTRVWSCEVLLHSGSLYIPVVRHRQY